MTKQDTTTTTNATIAANATATANATIAANATTATNATARVNAAPAANATARASITNTPNCQLFLEAPQLTWAVIGCGNIAHQMAKTLKRFDRQFYAVFNRSYQHALSFAQRYGIDQVYQTVEELLADKNIDAIYLATPHNTHSIYLQKALAAKKHVLCEKSITLNLKELKAAQTLAEQNQLQLMDACTVFHMPLYKELAWRTQAGDFGRVNLVQANFGSYKDYDMANRFFNPRLAGGAMLDIGVYALSAARLFLDSNPIEFCSLMNSAATGVDETSGIVLRNVEGQQVTLTLSLHSKQPKRVVISADKAYIEIMDYPRADVARIVWTADGSVEELCAGKTEDALAYALADLEQAVLGDTFARAQFAYSRDVMELMTRLRASWGFYYPEERSCAPFSALVDSDIAARTAAPTTHPSFDQLIRTIWRLRQQDGCPWDIEQTHATLTPHMIEEAYEAVEAMQEAEAAFSANAAQATNPTDALDSTDSAGAAGPYKTSVPSTQEQQTHAKQTRAEQTRAANKLLEELGDVLEQVVLHAQIAADRGMFSIDDVARVLNEKLVRRHPHVFGTQEHSLLVADRQPSQDQHLQQDQHMQGAQQLQHNQQQLHVQQQLQHNQQQSHVQQTQANDQLSDQAPQNSEEVLDIWRAVKQQERASRGEEGEMPEGLLDSVPRSLPALMQCQKISDRAARAGFEWSDNKAIWVQVKEELDELEAEKIHTERREAEFGDVLFSLVNVARSEGIDAEAALAGANKRFRARWKLVEQAAVANNKQLQDITPKEYDRFWKQAKVELSDSEQ